MNPKCHTAAEPITRTVKTFQEAWEAAKKGARIRPVTSKRFWSFWESKAFEHDGASFRLEPDEILGEWEIQDQYRIGTFEEACQYSRTHVTREAVGVLLGVDVESLDGKLAVYYHPRMDGLWGRCGSAITPAHLTAQYRIPI